MNKKTKIGMGLLAVGVTAIAVKTAINCIKSEKEEEETTEDSSSKRVNTSSTENIYTSIQDVLNSWNNSDSF